MTTLFNYDPYYDDFDEDKNFMRVLFRPGYSVQARELTQLQTILSNQIEKFGNHIFKSGSPITGGKISLDDKAFYIKLENQYNNEDVVPDDFLNRTIISYNSADKYVRAKVIAIDTTGENPVLVLKYLSGDYFSESDEFKVYGANIFGQVYSSNAVGRSYVASIQEGVYYFKGQFVKVVPQFLVLELYYKIGYESSIVNSNPSYKIGIEFENAIIDEIDDTSLLDPAQGAFNYQAPGANRFQVQTTLSKRTLDSADESSFFEVIRIVKGVKTKEIDYPLYSDLEKTLAKRTYDESGNYTIDPFVISLEEGDSANGKFDVVLDPGKAYVGGYEFQTISPTTIELNRSRETANATDYDLPFNYTSSIVLNNIQGTLDISSFNEYDIHCVNKSSVNVSTTAAYNSTKIGTLRADMIVYNDATNTEIGNTHSFRTNIFGANNTPITGTLPASGSTNTVIKLPAGFSNNAGVNAYANLYFRITNGSGSGSILITESNASANTITLSESLAFTPQSNTFVIETDFRTAKSVVRRSGSSILFAGDIDTDSKSALTGFAYIEEPSRTSLIFDVPYDAVQAGSISNFDMYARKVYSNRSSSSGTINIAPDSPDTFSFAGTPGTLSDSTVLQNMICFVRSDSASNTLLGIAPNTVLSLANSNFSVVAESDGSVSVNLGVPGSQVVKADFIITTKLNNVENNSTGYIRGKQLIPVNTNVNLHDKVPYELDTSGDTLAAANSTSKTAISGTGWVFNDIGATFFDDETILQDLRTPGKVVSLQVPDVYEIIRIIDAGAVSANGGNVTTSMLGINMEENTVNSYDITDSYEFDNGQRKTHYDHATIKLKRGYSSPKGKILVQYSYLKHSGTGLFTVDSYLKSGSNFTYDDITKFNNVEDGKLMELRSCFDFRPTRSIGSTGFSGAINPHPDLTATLNYSYYLSRIDQIVIKPSREFSVISGKSSLDPIAPPIGSSDMLIYTLYIPGYTETVKDIKADFKNNRRYTMDDISAFDYRIKNLEYYVSMNTLERSASETKVLDSNGLERSKYGIIVDNFSSTDVQATYSDVGDDNRCLVEGEELKPASLMNTLDLNIVPSECTGNYKISGIGERKVMMLSYGSEMFARQPYGTKDVAISSALYANFNGTMTLFPEYSASVDIDTTSKVVFNSSETPSIAFQYNKSNLKYVADSQKSWKANKNSPYAKVSSSKWYVAPGTNTGSTTKPTWGNLVASQKAQKAAAAALKQKNLTTSSSVVNAGGFITDLSIQPYLKPSQIVFKAEGLRANTRFYTYFDEELVDGNVIVPTTVTLNTSSSLFNAGETLLIANSMSILTTNLASYLGGANSNYYNAVVVSNTEPNSNTIQIINETTQHLTGKYVFGLDSANVARISAVTDFRHGNTLVVNNSYTIQLNPTDAPSVNIAADPQRNFLTVVRNVNQKPATGYSYQGSYGSLFQIVDYNTTTKVATLNRPWGGVGPLIYSIGSLKSNKVGQASGAFWPIAARFRSGERTLRLTESKNNSYDADSISSAEAGYTSSGLSYSRTTLVDSVFSVPVEQRVIYGKRITKTTSITNDISGINSPLAQTFFVDPEVYPYGLFMNQVDLFFTAKDDENIPVRIQIRPTVNGAPHSDYWYPESVVTKYPSQINVSPDTPLINASTSTPFVFDVPVFLKPGLYALVVQSDSPDYQMWVAEKGKTTIRNEYVGTNPYIGTLYKSQNAMEYVPIINEDLMFQMWRCVFNSGPATFILKSPQQDSVEYIDSFRILEKKIESTADTPISLDYSYISKPISASKETTYTSVTPTTIYNMGEDSKYSVGYRRKEMANVGDFTVAISMSTDDDTVSPVVSLKNVSLNYWTNFVDNASIEEGDFNIIVPGSGYSNSSSITVNSTTGSGAEIYMIVDGANGNVVGINVVSGGSGYTDDYTIVFDDTESGSGVTSNCSITLNSEYDSSGGPVDARYITKPIVLADGFDAGDLRVYLDACKQGNSEIEVFYKILSTTDATEFKDRPYQKMECFNPTTTPSSTGTDYREYEYRPSLTTNEISYTSPAGITYNTFKTFAIKIIMTSNDESIVPKVKNLRIIATPGE